VGVGISWDNGKFILGGEGKGTVRRPSGGEDSPSQVRAYRAIVTAPHKTLETCALRVPRDTAT
jgi:hypothetical protein